MSAPIKIYQSEIKQFSELPLPCKTNSNPENGRKITDVCCTIIGILFAIIMLILAIVLLNKDNLYKSNFPADKSGNVCNYQQDSKGQTYPYLYFSDLDNPLANRYCLKQCPLLGNPPQCGFQTCKFGIYPTHPVSQGLGLYCMPDDSGLAAKLSKNAGIYSNMNVFQTIKNLLTGLLISTCLCLVWMLMVQCFPRFMVWFSIIFAMILLLITAVVFFVNSHGALSMGLGWTIFIGVFCCLLLLVFVYYLILHRRRLYICGQILYNATIMLKQKCSISFYIVLYALLTSLFTLLLVFQYIAYGSSNTPIFSNNQLFYIHHKPWFLTCLLFIQMIWGLSFLRDSFNYLISGYAIQWYFADQVRCCEPEKKFFCKNFGSVVGGSLLNGFFYIPSLIVSVLCDQADFCCCNFFDLVREDVYAYINLTGTDYCNSIRQCQYLCYRSQICRGSESTNRVFSLGGRLVTCLLSVLLMYIISINTTVGGHVPTSLLFGVFLRCLFITSYFIDIQVVIAESLLITFLAEYELDQIGYMDMKRCRESIKNVIHDLEAEHKLRNTKLIS